MSQSLALGVQSPAGDKIFSLPRTPGGQEHWLRGHPLPDITNLTHRCPTPHCPLQPTAQGTSEATLRSVPAQSHPSAGQVRGPAGQGNAHPVRRACQASSLLLLWGFLCAWAPGAEWKLSGGGISERALPEPGVSGKAPRGRETGVRS